MPTMPSDAANNRLAKDSRWDKQSRRAFSQDYKGRIIAEGYAGKYSELGQLVRREHLCSSHPREWRLRHWERWGDQLAETPEQRPEEEPEKANRRLSDGLQVAYDCLDPQNKHYPSSIKRPVVAPCVTALVEQPPVEYPSLGYRDPVGCLLKYQLFNPE